MIKLLLTTTMFCFSTLSMAYGSGDMFLDLPKDSNVSSLNDRHYSASLGRFLTPDQAKISISEYTYMSSNVIRNSDPSGLGLWSEFKAIIKGTRVRPSDFPASYDREVPREGTTRLKREDRGTHRAPVKSPRETVLSTVAVIPDTQIGISTPTLINDDYASWGDNDTSDILRHRLRTHNSPEYLNAYPPEYRPEWSKPSLYTEDIDLSTVAAKNKANSLSRTKAMTFNSLDMEMTIENAQAAEFNTSTGLVGSLTKNKKIMIATGVVALSVGGAALTSFEVLKHKPAFSPEPPAACPGVVQHPPPC